MIINEHLTKTFPGFCSSSSQAAQKRSRRFCEKARTSINTTKLYGTYFEQPQAGPQGEPYGCGE